MLCGTVLMIEGLAQRNFIYSNMGCFPEDAFQMLIAPTTRASYYPLERKGNPSVKCLHATFCLSEVIGNN